MCGLGKCMAVLYTCTFRLRAEINTDFCLHVLDFLNTSFQTTSHFRWLKINLILLGNLKYMYLAIVIHIKYIVALELSIHPNNSSNCSLFILQESCSPMHTDPGLNSSISKREAGDSLCKPVEEHQEPMQTDKGSSIPVLSSRKAIEKVVSIDVQRKSELLLLMQEDLFCTEISSH